MKGIVTKYRKKILAEATSGIRDDIPPITMIAFGDGADNGDSIKMPIESQNELFHEIKRYDVSEVKLINEIIARYTVEIPEAELQGISINEMALVDRNNGICAIKTFGNKVKDEDIIFTFEFDDEF